MANINDPPPVGSWIKDQTVRYSSLVDFWGQLAWGLFAWGDKSGQTSGKWTKTKL